MKKAILIVMVLSLFIVPVVFGGPAKQFCEETCSDDKVKYAFCVEKQILAMTMLVEIWEELPSFAPLTESFHVDMITHFIHENTLDSGAVDYVSAYGDYSKFIDELSLELDKKIEMEERKKGI